MLVIWGAHRTFVTLADVLPILLIGTHDAQSSKDIQRHPQGKSQTQMG